MFSYQSPVQLATEQTRIKSRFDQKKIKKLFRPLVLGGVAFLISTLIPLLYVINEHTIHFWDQAMYHDMTKDKAMSLRDTWPLTFETVKSQLIQTYSSTGRDYNDYHTLPITPFVLLFGQSRLVYILALSWCYLLPFALTIGLVATQLTTTNQKSIFWVAMYFTLLTPAVWLPVLNGYPDIFSAALIGLALYFYFKDVSLQNREYLFAISACFAASILFRRHFAYDVVVFFICIALHRLLLVVSRPDFSYKTVIHRLFLQGLRVSLIGIGMVVLLVLFGYPFVKRLLFTSYSHLYAAWEMPALTNVIYYYSFYGWVFVAAVGFGIYYIVKRKYNYSVPVVLWFIISFFVIISLIWVFKVKQLGFHYTLHFTPWVLLLAIGSVWTFWHNSSRRIKLLIVCTSAAFVCINLFASLTHVKYISPAPYAFMKEKPFGKAEMLSTFVAASYPPPKREDYSQLVGIVDYLRTVASPTDPIYVAASSFIFNPGILEHIVNGEYDRSYTKPTVTAETRLNIMTWIPFADTKDGYPIDKLIQAKFIVVSSPVQYHLRPEVQELVSVVNAAFAQEWPFSKDFKLLPATFTFRNNVKARIYQRVNPTTLSVALQTLQMIDAFMHNTPGGQLDWIGLNAEDNYSVFRHLNGKYQLKCNLSKQTSFSFLHINNPEQSVRIKGNLSAEKNAKQIDPVKITMIALDSAGATVGSVAHRITKPGDFDLGFRSIPTQARFFMLAVSSKAKLAEKQAEYWLTLDHLTTTK